jgi:hypothetical protein
MVCVSVKKSQWLNNRHNHYLHIWSRFKIYDAKEWGWVVDDPCQPTCFKDRGVRTGYKLNESWFGLKHCHIRLAILVMQFYFSFWISYKYTSSKVVSNLKCVKH